MSGPRILLVIGGGIAAYKACELVRLIRKGGGEVTCVLTEGGAKFVTPMALAALSENPVYTTLWDLKNEVEMGHIQLSRQADLIVVCPATADLMAKMAAGIADDLATTLLLATDKPVMAIPAMNVRMWEHAATVRNVESLRSAGVDVMDPDEGTMACGEWGPGRLPDPVAIWNRVAWALGIENTIPDLLPEARTAAALPEPEDDFDSASESMFGGLSGSMISRSGAKKQAISFDAPDAESQSQELEAPADSGITPLAGSPLLSKKGSAKGAPPTDPAAINHLVSPYEDFPAPEPFGDDAEGAAALDGTTEAAEAGSGTALDPLDGLPDLDDGAPRPLEGKHVLVTAGPTWEPIDPVRYIANRSSGKQGYAIAREAARAGARVTLVSGPVHLETPPGVDRVDVESAVEMAEAVKKALPADIAVMVAAVADWRTANIAREKIKKRGSAPPVLMLTENPDILATVASRPDRPPLLIGFAAETEDVVRYAKEKRKRKGADWIIANDVSGDVMGGDANAVHIVSGDSVDSLPEMSKDDVARIIVERFADALKR